MMPFVSDPKETAWLLAPTGSRQYLGCQGYRSLRFKTQRPQKDAANRDQSRRRNPIWRKELAGSSLSDEGGLGARAPPQKKSPSQD
jgi:hypothetical protein